MKPICVKDRCFYQPEKNGVWFTEGMPVGGTRPRRGNHHPTMWKPYKLWQGDLWKCPECEHVIIVGVGQEPFSEHYKPEFKELNTKFSELQINDC